jgi:broad specificity phosphatase PhoE
VRHSESQANVAATQTKEAGTSVINVPARDADVELSATGRAQATAPGRLFGDYPEPGQATSVWSSPNVRAQQTADIATVAGTDVLIDERTPSSSSG